MNTDKILPVNREHLLLMQVLCWLAPGINILKVGVKCAIEIVNTHPERVWWLSPIAVFVLVSFLLMFHGFVTRYTNRILSFPERKKSLFAFFDLKGYCIIIFMMCLGISLKFIPGIPVDFFACFYPGLGTALTVSGIRFFVSWCKAMAVRR